MCGVLAPFKALGGAFGTILGGFDDANAQYAQAKWQAQMEQKQEYEARENAQIQAAQQESVRTREYARIKSAAMAAIGASGVGDYISYFDAAAPEDRKALGRDIANIRLNLVQTEATIADQVKVTEMGRRIAKYNQGTAKVGAISDFMAQATKMAAMYA